MLTVGSLFSGIGGFDLGLERAGMRIEWQVENNDYCREVLNKHWPSTPCHYDIKAIDWRDIPRVDLICGGFPCQPFSLAGKRRGKSDDRYLWPEVVRCLDTLRPAWFLGENVPGLINLALDQVCADLESLGYAVWPVCVPACAVDAPHQRQRIWIVAYADGSRTMGEERNGNSHNIQWDTKKKVQKREDELAWIDGTSHEDVAHAERAGSQGYRRECGLGEGGEEIEAGRSGDVADAISEQSERRRDGIERGKRSESQAARDGRQRRGIENAGWAVEPELGRVAHGVSRRVDRLRGLGNAVVPQVVEAFGRMILDVEAITM